jgi:sigma-B regulation protein RsbU (phosphoserine phosphatase)
MISRAESKRLKVSNFKLNSLLDLTRAINENLPVDELLQRYENILRQELNIGKILIYKFDDNWHCILKSGVNDSIDKEINICQELCKYEEISFISAQQRNHLAPFDIIIPVFNNNEHLAYVLIGDIDKEEKGVSPTIKHLNFIQTLSNIILVAIENIRLFNESLRQESLRKELELASNVQGMLVPDENDLPKNDKIRVKGFYKPHFDVGGDYYDCIELDKNEIGFCIADVSGKGISAALLMSNFQANLRALFTHEINLPALVEKLNKRVIEAANGEKFITLFIAKYNYKTKELEYINAAHNPPLIYDIEKQEMTQLQNGCVGMGMLDEIPIIRKGFITIDKPTKILCYTDGLVDLVTERGISSDLAPIEDALKNNESIDKNIDTIIKRQGINEDNEAIFDDISMLGIEIY